jgi:hypothetical protein
MVEGQTLLFPSLSSFQSGKDFHKPKIKCLQIDDLNSKESEQMESNQAEDKTY